jgi:hypothetical protein
MKDSPWLESKKERRTCQRFSSIFFDFLRFGGLMEGITLPAF